jgi:hypothetical protein
MHEFSPLPYSKDIIISSLYMWSPVLNYFLKAFLLKVVIKKLKLLSLHLFLVFMLYNLKIADIFINFVVYP